MKNERNVYLFFKTGNRCVLIKKSQKKCIVMFQKVRILFPHRLSESKKKKKTYHELFSVKRHDTDSLYTLKNDKICHFMCYICVISQS